MLRVPAWRRYLRFWRSDVQSDVDDELRFHFEARTAELRARGLAPAEVANTIDAEFGNLDATKVAMLAIATRVERRRERHTWLRNLHADVTYAVRGLRAAPLFAVSVVVTVAVGVASAVLMYGTMRELLLQPPPQVAAPHELARPYFHYRPAHDSARTYDQFSFPFWEELRRNSRTLRAVAAYDPGDDVILGRGSDARHVRPTYVSAGFWSALGVRPAVGRFIADDEAHPATVARVVVLSYEMWRDQFGSDPDVVATRVDIRGQSYQVVGVAPPGFRGVELTNSDIWLPLSAITDGTGASPGWHLAAGSARLKFVLRPRPSISWDRVTAELTQLHAAIVAETSRPLVAQGRSLPTTQVTVAPAGGSYGTDGRELAEARVARWLVGVAFALLAVAGANVASLLLLRAFRRRREIAVRLALGMSQRRLAALLFAESAVLAISGGVLSLGLVLWGHVWMQRLLLQDLVDATAPLHWSNLVVAAASVAAVAIVAGGVPMRQARADAAVTLKQSGQHGSTQRSRMQWVLLVAQTALSVALLIGAGAFLRSLHRVTTMDLGFEADRSLVSNLDFAGLGWTGGEQTRFVEEALARVRAVPDVEAASIATSAPLRVAQGALLRTRPDGDWLKTPNGSPLVNAVSGDFFNAAGMRIVAGRAITEADRRIDPVVVVNEALANAAWGGESPVGQCAYLSFAPTSCVRVVGVVRNAYTFHLREAHRPWMYVPLREGATDARVLLVRVAGDVARTSRTVRTAIRGPVSASAPFVTIEPLGDALDPQIRPWRLGSAVFTGFGAAAMLLAALGLYATVSYAVTQRTREIGVRVALGASPRSVLRLVLGDGVRIALVGVVLGLCASMSAAPWLDKLLFDIPSHEPTVVLAVVVLLLMVAGLASVIPAIRAIRVPPTESLRTD